MKAKKSLGQNFLTSEAAVFKIVAAGELSNNDTVLEIGPGRGALTRKLLATGANVICIEKDRELIPLLSDEFADCISSGQLTLIEGDILDIDISNIIKSKYKLIANIPYYITGAIIRKFCEASHKPERMILLVQKEVAERIVAADKKESILSISVKVYAKAKIVTRVSAGSFYPKPKVDSAVISLTEIATPFSDKTEESIFFDILHSGFAHKRKMLISNLKSLVGTEYFKDGSPRLKLLNKYLESSKGSKARAEDLNTADWINILRSING